MEGVNALQKMTPKYRIMLRHTDVAGETGSIADEFTYAQLTGAWRSDTKVLINTPRLTALSKNPDASNPLLKLSFYNDDTGNRTEAHVQFANFESLLAFGLEGTTTNQLQFDRTVAIRLNTGTRQVTSGFQFDTSVPLPPPPLWGQL